MAIVVIRELYADSDDHAVTTDIASKLECGKRYCLYKGLPLRSRFLENIVPRHESLRQLAGLQNGHQFLRIN